jgi:hypothetical protein
MSIEEQTLEVFEEMGYRAAVVFYHRNANFGGMFADSQKICSRLFGT